MWGAGPALRHEGLVGRAAEGVALVVDFAEVAAAGVLGVVVLDWVSAWSLYSGGDCKLCKSYSNNVHPAAIQVTKRPYALRSCGLTQHMFGFQ